jgi:alginate O-acetyltransferase complex protein AlgI
MLGLIIAANLMLLFYYKYANFFCIQIGTALGWFNVHWQPVLEVALPLGISFFIFKAISYQLEVYHQITTPAERFVDFGAYLTLFPQLAAGPIARYSETRHDLHERHVSLDLFFSGIQRFSWGLGKKVLIANSLGQAANKIFALGDGELTTPLAWLGAVCYSFQIYYDFSGYTDMAIGVGNFFGFQFPENFNQPYRSRNITEFWRRWHMTLSFWFRDFLFLPLEHTMARWWRTNDSSTGRIGAYWADHWHGKRGPAWRTCLSLMVVFSLCGFWHGAAWTFILWGAYHGFFLAVEMTVKKKFKWQSSGVAGILLTFFLVTLGWVLFRAETTATAWMYLKALFGFNPRGGNFVYFPFRYYLQNDVIFYLAIAGFFAWLPVERLARMGIWEQPWGTAFRGTASMLVMSYSVMVLSTSGFNPFIYFRF